MATFRDRYDPLKLFFRRLFTLGLLIVVLVVGAGVWKVHVKERESRILREQAESQRAELEKQAAHLGAETAKLKTERGKEEALREQYDVGKQGEGLIVIVDPSTPQPLQATSTFMQKVKKFLFWW